MSEGGRRERGRNGGGREEGNVILAVAVERELDFRFCEGDRVDVLV